MHRTVLASPLRAQSSQLHRVKRYRELIDSSASKSEHQISKLKGRGSGSGGAMGWWRGERLFSPMDRGKYLRTYSVANFPSPKGKDQCVR